MKSVFIPIAEAQGVAVGPPAGICDPSDPSQEACAQACNFRFGDIHFNCIPVYISTLTFIVIGFAATLCLLFIIVNGFRYMVGPLTEGSSESAKKGIMYALIGLAVCLLSYLILDTIIVRITG